MATEEELVAGELIRGNGRLYRFTDSAFVLLKVRTSEGSAAGEKNGVWSLVLQNVECGCCGGGTGEIGQSADCSVKGGCEGR